MVDFKKLEEDLKGKVEDLVHDAEAHEPAIEDAAMSALTAVGCPSEIATAFGALLSNTLAHFKGQHTPEAAAQEGGGGGGGEAPSTGWTAVEPAAQES